MSQNLEALEKAFPGVMVHENGDRVRIVYGVPMTTGKTAREAAEEWLTEYVGVFGQDDPDLTEQSIVVTNSGKTFLAYRQSIDGLPVEGSRVTVVVGAGETPTVAYVAARVGLRPKGGFAEPLLTANQAVGAASKHQQASGLTSWGTPALIAFYNESLTSGAEAAQVYKCIGSNAALTESYSFYVDAGTGDVLMVVKNILHSADITGTVSAYATLGVEPHTWGDDSIDPPTGTIVDCPNDPVLFDALPYALVEALEAGTSTVVDAVFADGNGDYTLDVPGSTEVDVRAWLIGPAWEVRDSREDPLGTPPLADPVEYTDNPVPAPASGIGMRFNTASPPDELDTANVNAHLNLARSWRYFKDRIDSSDELPGLDDVIQVWTNRYSPFCNSQYVPSTPPSLRHGRSQPYPNDCPNDSYSTITTHEYGHYLLHQMLGIVPGVSPHGTFHGGFADTYAHLVHDTLIYGERGLSCTGHLREPLNPRREYPYCAGGTYENGMVLSGAWLDTLINIDDLEATRQLHVHWAFLTQGGATGGTGCTAVGQAAHPGTLIEVLTADDDDNDLANGTPHCEEIVAAFDDHGIVYGGSCGGSRPSGSTRAFRVDCDRDGTVSVADWTCYQVMYASRSLGADCNRDRRVSADDIICFHRRVLAANRRR